MLGLTPRGAIARKPLDPNLSGRVLAVKWRLRGWRLRGSHHRETKPRLSRASPRRRLVAEGPTGFGA
jgi:hypothetical protein